MKHSIELREFALSVPFFGAIASHQFWVRYNSNGQITGEIHGFATNTAGQPLSVSFQSGGAGTDTLRAHVYPKSGQPNTLPSTTAGDFQS